jgi:BlaI family transcriptional regulator, penicillinase repressor
MARPPNTQPTDGELEILKLLWSEGSSELGQITAALNEERKVATTTVATMLKVMLDKRLVTRKRGDRGYQWSAKVSRENAEAGLTGKLVDRLFDGSARRLVAHLIEDGQLTAADRREIQQLLGRSQAAKRRKRGGE